MAGIDIKKPAMASNSEEVSGKTTKPPLKDLRLYKYKEGVLRNQRADFSENAKAGRGQVSEGHFNSGYMTKLFPDRQYHSGLFFCW